MILIQLGFFLGTVLAVGGCAGRSLSVKQNRGSVLEKHIFSLEDQIASQKRKIVHLEQKLSHGSAEEVLADSQDEGMHLYHAGLKFREQGQWESAAQLFNEFVTQNPDHVYADRAQFLLLSSHFKLGEFGLVLTNSRFFENRFPESSKLPEVLYLSALAHIKLGDHERGISGLKTLVSGFPRSAIVTQAQQELIQYQTGGVLQ
ncbi:outer membrane protein assembly factor BamD [bacterium]|nr:outer membrane protein assembly factor BamD [bacterium]